MKETTMKMINHALDVITDNEDTAVEVVTSVEFNGGICNIKFDLENGYSLCMTTFESSFDAGDIDSKEEYKQSMAEDIYAVEMYIGVPDEQSGKITKLYNRVFVTNECYTDIQTENEFKREDFGVYVIVDEIDKSHDTVKFEDVKEYIEALCGLIVAGDMDSLELNYCCE